MSLTLIVDNTKIIRDATFDRHTRLNLGDASNGLRTLAAIIDEARRVDRGDMSLTGLGQVVSKHLRGMEALEIRECAMSIDDVVERWDANEATEIVGAGAREPFGDAS